MSKDLKKDLKELGKAIIWFILAGIGVISIGVGGRELNYSLGSDDKSGIIVSLILLAIGITCMGLIAYFYERK
ncbi:hypothetical protein C0585_04930 [Candidatus Woesearchaeota archaeon]|nr:MAG: hypothetical protein C0585_04930 [Candidatus Woesearchaeota archaeon]